MCELSNWNGRVYKISRNELMEFAKRSDSEYTGVYFLLLKGSSIAINTVPSMSANLLQLRTSLITKGIIDSEYRFLKDHIFTSPSLAAAVVMGRNANGRTEWKTIDNRTLKSIEEEDLG